MSCFDEAGFDATTIAQITERADVARRTFFRYFPTKEAVLFSDFTTRQDHVLEMVGARPIGESPLESVLSALREMSVTPPDAGRVRRIQRIVRASPTLLERERSLVQYGFADRLTVTVADRLRSSGAQELSPLQLRVMVGSALLCYESAVMAHVVGGAGPLTAIFDEAVDACRESWAAQGVAMP
jgi:AcrR family transcriptional regulator